MSKIRDFILKFSKNDMSDIHIREGEYIYYRKEGLLLKSDLRIYREDIVSFLEENNIFFIKKLNHVKEIDFSLVLFQSTMRFRANMFLTMSKIALVLRLIKEDIKSFKELNLTISEEQISDFSSGLIFITGPTGSGKTSSQAAIIEYINKNFSKHIICIEDPIEYSFINKKSIISQREIGCDSLDFNRALVSSLRQDPDIIVIGEVRDFQTLDIAMKAAETGHLCFCTMHTLGIRSTIERILGLVDGVEREDILMQLSQLIRCVLSQQLVILRDGTRVPVVEFTKLDKSISNLIREGKLNQLESYIMTKSKQGMINMDKELIKLHEEGLISHRDLIKLCIDREFVKNKVSVNGGEFYVY